MVPAHERIQEWPDQRLTLYSHRELKDYLIVEAFRENALQQETFTCAPLDRSIGIDLIHIFHQVIATRLEGLDPFRRNTYLPIYYADAMRYAQGTWEKIPALKVVLFGNFNWSLGLTIDQTHTLAWYVFNEIDRRIVFSSQENSDIVRKYATAVSINSASQFRAVVMSNSAGQIERVQMRYCSVINRDLLINESECAITLGSTQRRDSSTIEQKSIWRIFSNFAGHAVIFSEQIKDQQYCRKMIHFTNMPLKKIDLTLKEAVLEIRESPRTPSLYEFGPTWIRSPELVQGMLDYARSLENTPIKFAMVGGELYLKRTFFSWTRGEVDNPDWVLHELPHTCLEWAIVMLKKCGIFLMKVTPFTRPIQFVQTLKVVNQCYQIPRSFPHIIPGLSNVGELDVRSGPYQQLLEIRRHARRSMALITPFHWTQENISAAESMIFETSFEGLLRLRRAVNIQ